jgi:hypothetical protein
MASPKSGFDILQSVRFIASNGRRFAVLDADDWDALVEWLETLEDTGIARDAYERLKAAGGDRERAGWKEWQAVRGEIA